MGSYWNNQIAEKLPFEDVITVELDVDGSKTAGSLKKIRFYFRIRKLSVH